MSIFENKEQKEEISQEEFEIQQVRARYALKRRMQEHEEKVDHYTAEMIANPETIQPQNQTELKIIARALASYRIHLINSDSAVKQMLENMCKPKSNRIQ